ncbi:hypothetical protein HG530_006644 [Fusarium avenaceum]|nr:hypothetical protein HG530_006644 [Fusarium avenaceum]
MRPLPQLIQMLPQHSHSLPLKQNTIFKRSTLMNHIPLRRPEIGCSKIRKTPIRNDSIVVRSRLPPAHVFDRNPFSIAAHCLRKDLARQCIYLTYLDCYRDAVCGAAYEKFGDFGIDQLRDADEEIASGPTKQRVLCATDVRQTRDGVVDYHTEVC